VLRGKQRTGAPTAWGSNQSRRAHQVNQTSEAAPDGLNRRSIAGIGDDVMRVRAGKRRVGLVAWFLLLSLLSVSLVSISTAVLLDRYISDQLLRLDARLTTEFANHLFAFEGADAAFEGSPQKPVPPAVARFFAQVGQMPDVLRANIYLLDGTIFWSTQKSIVGQRFPDNDELAEAARGRSQAEIGEIGADDKDEHVDLAPPGTRFVENYLPMHRDGDPRQPVIAVAEVYRTPQDLFTTIQTGQRLVFVGAALGALLIVGALVSLVIYADRLIRRQAQEIADAERLATAGEMASAVAHGLRNPLAAIRSSAELALRLRAPERVFPLLDDIVLQSDRLEHWVRQYLMAAETNSGDRCADLGGVIEAVRGNLATEVERQGVVWETRLGEGMPALAIGSALVEQLLNGIAANAVEAMPEGGRLEISAARIGGMVEVRVVDTGCGMTPEQLLKVFKPFATTKQAGLGLGLALARRILARHHGRITVTSEPGRGTDVSVLFPIVKV
jgi:two-component system sensor histidine kinase HydH